MPEPSDSTLTSVIMVTHHTGPKLDRAIAAVLAQTAPVELILVDGNPPDVETRLAALAKDELRVKLITGHGAIGHGTGSNLGAKAAKGAFLLFLHPEAVLPSTAVGRLSGLAAKAKSPFMFGARLTDEHGRERPESRRAFLTPLVAFVETFFLAPYFPKFRLSLQATPVPAKIASVPALGGACMFLPAKDFWLIKGFDERCYEAIEDMDFCLRFHRAEGKIYFVPDVVVETAPDAGPLHSFEVEKKKAQGLAHYFHENFSHAWPQPVLWLLDATIWAKVAPAFFAHTLEGLVRKSKK